MRIGRTTDRRAIVVWMIAASAMLAAGVVTGPSAAAAQEKLCFAVGPFQPTPTDTRKAYEPFFKYLAEKLGRDYELVVN